jgi:glycosyltransferase involved in cell wall biosynthesis
MVMSVIDVVIPNYRYGRFLRQCVTSVLNQQHQEIRILIIDNASDDESVDVARALVAEDPRVSLVVHERNLGPHASFNEGIDWANSPYVMILCSDDYLAPGALQRALEVMEENKNVSFALGQEAYWYVDQPLPDLECTASQLQWQLIGGRRFIEGLCSDPNQSLACGTLLVRTSKQKLAGHYRASLPYADDWEMTMRLAAIGDVARTEAIQGIKRQHGGNLTHQFFAERLTSLVEREKAFDSFFSQEGRIFPEASALLGRVQSRLADTAYWSGVSRLARGRPREARELFDYAFSRNPWNRLLPPVSQLARMANPLERIAYVMSGRAGSS